MSTTRSRWSTRTGTRTRALFSSAFASTIDIAVTTGPGGGPPATSTALSSSLNPSTVGQSITLTAIVSGSSPTGTVQFLDNGINLGAPAALVGGTATLVTSALGQGAHSITAAYGGDAGNAASTSPVLVQNVNAVAVPVAPSQIPTLSEWGVIVLAALMAMLGLARLRERMPDRARPLRNRQ